MNLKSAAIASVATLALILTGCTNGSSGAVTITVQPPTVTVFGTSPQPAALESSSAPGESPSITPAPDPGVPLALGLSGSYEVFDMAATVTVFSTQWSPGPASEGYLDPHNGGYLVIDLAMSSTQGEVSYNPLYWVAVDAEGRKYEGDLGGSGYSPELSSGSLQPGEQVRGFVAFDVPEAVITQVKLTDPLGSTLLTWAVA